MKVKKPVFKHKLFKYVLRDIYQDYSFVIRGEARLTAAEASAKNEGYAMNGSPLRYQKV